MIATFLAPRLRAVWLALGLGICATLPAPAQVQLDLRDADLRSFITIVAEATGRSFVLDPNVRGTVTVISPDDLSADAIYEIFLNVLELNRLTIVPGADADRIVPLGTARELAVGGGTVQLDGEYQTRVIRVDNVPLSEVVEVVRPLLPAEALLSTVPRTNLLVLSDRGDNYRKIETLIARLDTAAADPIQMIRVRNADAADVLQVVQSLDIVPPGASVTVDRRSNALVVSGPSDLADRIRVLASRLDTQSNNTVSTVAQLNYADAAALSAVVLQSVQGAAPADGSAPVGDISIVPDPSSNALLISAPQERMSDILAIVHRLDRRPAQVLVEAVIFEMSVEGFSDLTAQFGGIVNSAIAGGVEFSLQGRPTLTSLVSSVVDGGIPSPGSGGSIGGGGNDFAGFLSAIATQQSTRLLSTPSILTLNNQEAEIVVAQTVPFVTGSFATVGDDAIPENPFQTIERQDVGLTLTVTPQVNADKTVRLNVEQEVSSLTQNNADAGGEITQRRALTTTVLVQSGNVVMLGGLLENGSGSNTQRVPGVSRLPVVGRLFQGKNASDRQRVLLVMLRPRVISNAHDAQRLTAEAARDARQATIAIQPDGQDTYPQTNLAPFPYDGADLNQPFDAGFIDDGARQRGYPPLPSRLRFRDR